MNDEPQAIEQSGESEPVEAGATSEQVTPESAQEQQDPTGETVSNQKEIETESINRGEDRPTRRDRRINKLIGKLKEQDRPKESNGDTDINRLFGNPKAPLITNEDVDIDGRINPEIINQRFEQKLYQDREILKKELRAEQQYKETVREHLSDAESTAKLLEGDDMLDEIVSEQFRMANYQTDPYTGQEIFVPKVKMSDIYKRQKELLDKRVAKETASTTTKLMEQSSTQAIPPTSGAEPSNDAKYESVFEDARESGDMKKWADVLKHHGF